MTLTTLVSPAVAAAITPPAPVSTTGAITSVPDLQALQVAITTAEGAVRGRILAAMPPSTASGLPGATLTPTQSAALTHAAMTASIDWAPVLAAPDNPAAVLWGQLKSAAGIPAGTAIPTGLAAAISSVIVAQNNYNLAVAQNKAVADSIAEMNKTFANMSLTDADIGTLLQLDYLKIYEPTIYGNVMTAAGQASIAATGSGLSGLGDFWSKAVDSVSSAVATLTHPFQVVIQHVVASSKNIAADIRKTPDWQKIVFPELVLGEALTKEIGANVMSSWSAIQPTVQKLIKYTPAIMLTRAIVPDSVYQSCKQFEHDHRQEIKIAAAVAAVVTGVIVVDPSLALNVADMVDTGIAKVAVYGASAAENVATSVATQQAVKAATANLSGPAKTAVAAATSATVASGMNAVYSGDPLSGIATTPQDVLNSIAAQIPDAAAVGSKIGDTLNQYINKIGADQVKALVAKYTASGPITSTTDPRFAQLQADLVSAANGGQTGIGTAAAINQSSGVNWKSWIVPGLAVVGFLFK